MKKAVFRLLFFYIALRSDNAINNTVSAVTKIIFLDFLILSEVKRFKSKTEMISTPITIMILAIPIPIKPKLSIKP